MDVLKDEREMSRRKCASRGKKRRCGRYEKQKSVRKGNIKGKEREDGYNKWRKRLMRRNGNEEENVITRSLKKEYIPTL